MQFILPIEIHFADWIFAQNRPHHHHFCSLKPSIAPRIDLYSLLMISIELNTICWTFFSSPNHLSKRPKSNQISKPLRHRKWFAKNYYQRSYSWDMQNLKKVLCWFNSTVIACLVCKYLKKKQDAPYNFFWPLDSFFSCFYFPFFIIFYQQFETEKMTSMSESNRKCSRILRS